MKNERVIVYIDGFNLYFGMREAGFDQCRWLNVRKLVENLLKPGQELKQIKYFTSRVSNNPDKQKRQSTYIDALESVNVKIIYGNYQSGSTECKRCGNIWQTSKEKMTDVNIATAMIIDAFKDEYDMAMLISGDSDLVPPIKSVHENFKNKRVFIAFPPKRHNSSMKLVAKGSLMIGRKILKNSQFDDEVISKSGYKLKIPESWK
ncbi:MAG: NYN domain-containing protein [Bacteroidales bacterium]